MTVSIMCYCCGADAELKPFKGNPKADVYLYCDSCGTNYRFHPKKSQQAKMKKLYSELTAEPVNENNQEERSREVSASKDASQEKLVNEIKPDIEQEKPVNEKPAKKSFFDF